LKVYIAHTYGKRHGLSKKQYTVNALKSIDWGIEVVKKGHNPFIPNLYHFVQERWEQKDGKGASEDTWFNFVSAWLKECDALFVAELPKWDGGVMAEIEMAKAMKIPIYWDIREVPDAT